MKNSKRGRKPEHERLKNVFDTWRKSKLAEDGFIEVFSSRSRDEYGIRLSKAELRHFRQCYGDAKPRSDFPKSWFCSPKGNVLKVFKNGEVVCVKPRTVIKKDGRMREYYWIGGIEVNLEPGAVVNSVFGGKAQLEAMKALQEEGLAALSKDGLVQLHHEDGYRYAKSVKDLNRLRAANCKNTVFLINGVHAAAHMVKWGIDGKAIDKIFKKLETEEEKEGIKSPIGILENGYGAIVGTPKFFESGKDVCLSISGHDMRLDFDGGEVDVCFLDEGGRELVKGVDVPADVYSAWEEAFQECLDNDFTLQIMVGKGAITHLTDCKSLSVYVKPRRLRIRAKGSPAA